MSSLRNLKVSRYLMLGLLLCVGSTTALAREAQMHGPNGDGGGCAPEPVATTIVAPAQTAKPAAAPATTPPSKAKPAVGVRGGSDDGGIHSSRWHSFLPGMFR